MSRIELFVGVLVCACVCACLGIVHAFTTTLIILLIGIVLHAVMICLRVLACMHLFTAGMGRCK